MESLSALLAPHKTCLRCLTPLPVFRFSRDASKASGLVTHCKTCVNERVRLRTGAIARRTRHPADRVTNSRRHTLRKRYGLSPKDYATILEAQDHRCAICREPESRKVCGMIQPLSVDHNHETGKVRGLLCNACNLSIGGLGDSSARLRSAADYLDSWSD